MGLTFNGTSQYISFGSAVDIHRARPLTVVALIKPGTLTAYNGIIGEGDTGASPKTGWDFGIGASTNKLYADFGIATGYAESTLTIANNSGWWLVGFTFRAGAGTVDFFSYSYNTGAYSSNTVTGLTNADPAAPTGSQLAEIGGYYWGGNPLDSPWIGTIGWVGVWAADLVGGSTNPPIIRQLIDLQRGPWTLLDGRCKLFIPLNGDYRDLSIRRRVATPVASPTFTTDPYTMRGRRRALGGSGRQPALIFITPQSSGGTVYSQVVNALSTSSAALLKQIGKVISLSEATSAAQSKQTGKLLGAASASSATALKQANKNVVASTVLSVTIAAIKTILLTLSASLSSVAGLLKQINKLAGSSQSSAVSLVKRANKSLSTGQGSSTTLLKKVLTTLATTPITTLATLVKQVGKISSVMVAIAATQTRRVVKSVVANANVGASLLKQINKTLSASSVLSALVAALKTGGTVFYQALSAGVTGSAGVVKQVGKVTSAGVSSAVGIVKRIGVGQTAVEITVAGLTKQAAKRLAASTLSSASVAAIKTILVVITASVGTVAKIVKQTGKFVTLQVGNNSTLSKVVRLGITVNSAVLTNLYKLVSKRLTTTSILSTIVSAIRSAFKKNQPAGIFQLLPPPSGSFSLVNSPEAIFRLATGATGQWHLVPGPDGRMQLVSSPQATLEIVAGAQGQLGIVNEVRGTFRLKEGPKGVIEIVIQ